MKHSNTIFDYLSTTLILLLIWGLSFSLYTTLSIAISNRNFKPDHDQAEYKNAAANRTYYGIISDNSEVRLMINSQTKIELSEFTFVLVTKRIEIRNVRAEPILLGDGRNISTAITYYARTGLGNIYAYVGDGGNSIMGPPLTESWIDVVFVYDGELMSLYVDGKKYGKSKKLNVDSIALSNMLGIYGKKNATSLGIAEIIIFSNALSSKEISDLHFNRFSESGNNMKLVAIDDSKMPSGVLGHWVIHRTRSFDESHSFLDISRSHWTSKMMGVKIEKLNK
jgi:hypothetical protein